MRNLFNEVKSYYSCFQFFITDKQLKYSMKRYEGEAVKWN